ncbi:MAG: response regulator [Desulforhopalus sp.]
MKVKALVVDNNPVLLRAVSVILSQEGCTVQTAETGLEALEVVDEFCPDIVYTDLIMPMVSGEQLCRILRNMKKHEEVFIVVLSAIIIEDRERILREVQCDVCIAKGNLQTIRHHVLEALQAYKELKNNNPDRNRKAAHIAEGLKPSGMTSELLFEKRHYSDIIANLDEGIIELNHQGKVVAANSSALQIISASEETIVGTSLPAVIDWDNFDQAVRGWTESQLIALGMGKYDIYEDQPLFYNNRVLTASFIPISEADSVFGLCILRDISRQFKAEQHHKELDDALKLVKKMDAMSCMAGGVSHDFNNLLTVICGNLDILAVHGASQSIIARNNLLGEARKAALIAVDLTRQISCFSNFGIVNREKVEIEKLVRNTVGTFFDWEENQYRLKLTRKDRHVYADPEELSLAIVNVLQNAVEASSGQRVDITISENVFTTPELLSGQYVPAGKYSRIDVCDRGPGISSEQLFRIFDPYYSTKVRGTLKGMGLGLTVVYAILRNHGGYVVVTSILDQGTTVSLYLPYLQDEKTTFSSPEGSPAKERFVLLVEPDPQMCEICKIMLGYLGFSVRTAGDRAGAMHELKQFSDDPSLPLPLVIIALADTGGESAVETCRLLHAMNPHLKVIAMSGSVLDPVMENYRAYGFVNTLPQPFSMDSLRHITNSVFHT